MRGEEVQLTQREFDVLLFLARHPGQVFSRNQLMDAVWQYSFYSDTLDGDRAHPPAALEDRGRSRCSPRTSRRFGESATVFSRERAGWLGLTARRRAPSLACASGIGSLRASSRSAVAIVVAPVLIALVVVGYLMVVSDHAAALVAGDRAGRRRRSRRSPPSLWPTRSCVTSARSATGSRPSAAGSARYGSRPRSVMSSASWRAPRTR